MWMLTLPPFSWTRIIPGLNLNYSFSRLDLECWVGLSIVLYLAGTVLAASSGNTVLGWIGSKMKLWSDFVVALSFHHSQTIQTTSTVAKEIIEKTAKHQL
jgi:hypothetical protein